MKVALAGIGRFGGHVFGDNRESLVVRGDLIAVGPVAAEDDAVRAEEVPEGIKLFAVVPAIANERTVFDGWDLRELDVDAGVLRERNEISAIVGDGVGISDHLRIGEMVDDDAELRDCVRNLEKSADEARVGIGALEDEAGIGEGTESIVKVRLREVVEQVAVPEIAVADAEEERVFVKAVELIAEGGVGGIEVPDDAEDEWVGPGNIEQPVIIGEKRAALNGDAASDSKLPGESLQTRRKSRLIEGGYVRSWPGHSAGAGWIEEVNVSVNDLRHCW